MSSAAAALTLTSNIRSGISSDSGAGSSTTSTRPRNNPLAPKSSSDETAATATTWLHQQHSHTRTTTTTTGDSPLLYYDEDNYEQHSSTSTEQNDGIVLDDKKGTVDDDNDGTTTTPHDAAATAAPPPCLLQVPDGHGLLLQWHGRDGSVTVSAVPDRQCPAVHPHCYAPAALRNVALLHGGGSGTAVFGGAFAPPPGPDDDLPRRVVMKHGGSKDTAEVLALAAIARELLRRQQQQRLLAVSNSSTATESSAAAAAAARMKARIPEFAMVYISRHHLRERTRELWNFLRTITYTLSGRRLSLVANANSSGARKTLSHNDLSQLAAEAAAASGNAAGGKNNDKNSDDDDDDDGGGDPNSNRNHRRRNRAGSVALPPPAVVLQSELQELRAARALRVVPGHSAEVRVLDNDDDTVEIVVPGCDANGRIAAGGAFLRDFQRALAEQQDRHNWKVTLGQKWIGAGAEEADDPDGSHAATTAAADNGADVLTSGRLLGTLLETLIHEFTSIMQDLNALTLPEERRGVFERVRQEVVELHEIGDVRAVSKEADSFVGGAVLKNFHPGHGRFRNLRLLGDDFRDGDFFLTDRERPAAGILARLLQRGTALEDVFVDAPDSVSALDRMEDRGWLDILQHAVQFENNCPSATECIWTCGLTDAGLHNTFLSADRGLEVFDLGEPGLEPRPAFLTKFLMSFFHTLGMEDDGGGSWKTRFNVVEMKNGTKRLSLTAETEEKVPYIENVFTTTLDHFIEHIFNGNESVRTLLIKYVILQLLSDSSFCLQRWESKGGGSKRYGERLQYPMEKWLWRSLWDQYIASYVHAHLLNE